MTTYIVEINESQYLGTMSVVDDIQYAEEFDNEPDAQDQAAMYNADNGRGGKIIARVRTFSNER